MEQSAKMTLCMQNLLTHLNPDWINSGLIKKLFMIIVPKFKELEVEVKFIRNCLDELYCSLWILKRRAKRLHACARIFRLRLRLVICKSWPVGDISSEHLKRLYEWLHTWTVQIMGHCQEWWHLGCQWWGALHHLMLFSPATCMAVGRD